MANEKKTVEELREALKYLEYKSNYSDVLNALDELDQLRKENDELRPLLKDMINISEALRANLDKAVGLLREVPDLSIAEETVLYDLQIKVSDFLHTLTTEESP